MRGQKPLNAYCHRRAKPRFLGPGFRLGVGSGLTIKTRSRSRGSLRQGKNSGDRTLKGAWADRTVDKWAEIQLIEDRLDELSARE
jgi:hypothetical protein